MRGKKPYELPTVSEIKRELRRERYKLRYGLTLKSTVYLLITVAAAAVLVAVLWLPVLQIYGTSMTPTLKEGDIVVSVKSPNISRGDIIGFYYNNKLLVKRVVGMPGEVLDIDKDGNVYIDGELLEEAYLDEKALSEYDISLPFEVPDERYFVLGDHRSNSLDSRNAVFGCVSKDQIVGKLIFRIYPIGEMGRI